MQISTIEARKKKRKRIEIQKKDPFEQNFSRVHKIASAVLENWLKGFAIGVLLYGGVVMPLGHLASRYDLYDSPYAVGWEGIVPIKSFCPIESHVEEVNEQIRAEVLNAVRGIDGLSEAEIAEVDTFVEQNYLFSSYSFKKEEFLSSCIKAPLFEEGLFRGVIQEGLLRQCPRLFSAGRKAFDGRLSKGIRIASTSLFFALNHVKDAATTPSSQELLAHKVCAFGLGFICGVLKESNQGITASWGAHVAYNLVGQLRFFLAC